MFRGAYDHAIPLMRKSGVMRSGMMFFCFSGESGERGDEVDDICMRGWGTWVDDTSSGDEVDFGWMMASV